MSISCRIATVRLRPVNHQHRPPSAGPGSRGDVPPVPTRSGEAEIVSQATYLILGDLHGRVLPAFRLAMIWGGLRCPHRRVVAGRGPRRLPRPYPARQGGDPAFRHPATPASPWTPLAGLSASGTGTSR